jgi:Ca-activated chloride channel homolog
MAEQGPLAGKKFDWIPMKSPRKILVFAITSALIGTAAFLRAQNPPPPPGPLPQSQPQNPAQRPPTVTVTTTEVIVPVTVKDRSSNLVTGLNKDDFRIFEDSVEQRVIRFITDSFPISMVVLIDNDLGQKDEDQVEPSLVSIIGGMSADDEAVVCRFDQYFHEGKGFTRDQDKLTTELHRTVLASHSSAPPVGDPFSGPTINNAPAPGTNTGADPRTMLQVKGQTTKALDDAVFNAAMLLKDRDSQKRRKIILLISDGQNGAKFNTHKYDETKAELLHQGIAVYSVATGSQYFNRKFTRLSEYSHDTGGDIYYGAKQDTFSEFYSRITEEARNQYTLVYSPVGEKSIDYHTIEVRVKREGLTVLAREGYYGGTYASPR